MEEQLNDISRKMDKLDTLFTSAMNKVNERDDTIKQKDARITELTDKLTLVSKEKDDALWAKIDLMKQITAEREQLHSQVTGIQQEMLKKDQKLKKLKEKSRAAQDGLIGSSFEQDRLKKQVEEKDKSLQEIEEKIASVASGSTGILYDVKSSIEYLMLRIKEANRSLRIVAPTIDFMKETGLFDAINELPDSCVVNIATALDLAEHSSIIESWKNRGWYVNNYQDKNFLMASSNGSNVSIAFITQGMVSGFYSNIADLVTIFKQALMHPFIKGQKL